MTMDPNDPRRATTTDRNRVDPNDTRRRRGSSTGKWVTALVAIALVVAVVIGFGLLGTEDTVVDPVATTTMPENPTVVEDQAAPAIIEEETETGAVGTVEPIEPETTPGVTDPDTTVIIEEEVEPLTPPAAQ